MADFNTIRSQLNQTRTDADVVRLELFHAQQKLQQIVEAQAQLTRHFNPNNHQHQARRNQLEKELKKTQAKIAQLSDQQASITADLAGNWQVFVPLTDPRQAIGFFSTAFPILLFPLRLETRFKTVTIGGRQVPQLWVRIYPDDCLVDSFEVTPSLTEIDNTQRYWAGIWKAGGDEGLERAAFRNLASSHGSGRAAYLTGIYTPSLASDVKPVRANADEIILVIPTEEPLTLPGEISALKNYWEAVWRAGDNAADLQAAFSALTGAVGVERAEELNKTHVPFNIADLPNPGVNRATASVRVVTVVFPKTEDIPTKNAAWTQAAKVNMLPECFVLIGDSGAEHIEVLGNPVVSPLIVSPDPLESEDKQFKLDDEGNLVVPDYLKWMTDFEAAVEAGMGFKVNLTPNQAANGFDRLQVVGVRLSADEREGKRLLETLLTHHNQSSTGFAIVPQGTPTNNTEEESAGFSRSADADLTFDILKKIETDGWQFVETETDDAKKRDGLWLAQFLGVDAAIFQKTPHADGKDQCEARAMNTALFPATLGYWMDTQMLPVFNDDTVERTRNFFRNYVSGRGAIPAIRIGKQPYGILPATNFSNMAWITAKPDSIITSHVALFNSEHLFLRNLYGILLKLDDLFWKNWANNVPHTGQATNNPQQQLLDLVGLHPASVEYYQQWAESIDHLWNRLKFHFFIDWTPLWNKVITLLFGGPLLLQQMGYSGDTPELLEKVFFNKPNLLKGPVVDNDPPLSETDPLRVVTSDGKNYIEWLVEKASTNMDDLRTQKGFTDNKPPNSLLYLKLRHALELGYYDLSFRLHRQAELIAPASQVTFRKEPVFVHVAEKAQVSESRYQMLYKTEPRITGNPNLTVAQYIPSILPNLQIARYLYEQIEALKHLAKTPTARLERLFAEHIDCCSYRWDAWMLALAHYRLHQMRADQVADDEQNLGSGIYIGAFGWVENLKPDKSVLAPVTLPADLDKIFNQPGDPPLLRDNQNFGYVHAPSLNHAVTAAVLRNGYMHNATPSQPDLLSVNLSSGRVRTAMQFIEGIRNGQSLGALLGYQLERALHDRYNEAEVDVFIFEIRKAFPLVAKRIKDTLAPDDEPVEKIEARNVVDGLRLLDHVKASAVKTYPWGKNLKRGTPAQESIINQEVNRLMDIQDAIADLAVAESVHQVVQGNYDRAAASLDAYSRATFPPDPDVATTPRSGVTLTHRVGLHLPIAPAPGMTPRSIAEPAINQWLATVLPAPANIAVQAAYRHPVTGVLQENETVTWSDLGLELIDLLYILDTSDEQAMTQVDDRVYHFLTNKYALRPDAEVEIRYTETLAGKVTLFELQPLVSALRALLLQSRPLKPGDVAMPNEAKSAAEAEVSVPEARITATRTEVNNLLTAAKNLAASLEPLAVLDPETATEPEITNLLNQFDGLFNQFLSLQLQAGRCGIALSGFGWAMNTRKQLFTGIVQKAKDLAGRWAQKAAEHDQLVADSLDITLTLEEQYDLLMRAERTIATEYTLPLPVSPNDFRTMLAGKKAAFDTARAQVNALVTTATTSVQALVSQWEAIFPFTEAHDLEAIDQQAERRQVLLFVQDLHNQTTGLVGEVQKRVDDADAKIALAGTSTGEKKVQALVDAAKHLLGDDFRVVPQFSLQPDQGDEWQNAWNSRVALTSWLESQGVDFPVDDWLYGVARVRTKLHDWENVLQLTGAFGLTEPVLTPLQFPFVANEPWLALDYPPDFQVDKTGEKLLYTACYGGGDFSKNTAQCGLLLDEWTEVIPGKEETTGIAFHYDRPNNEPPQALLLAIPSGIGPNWTWDDLTAAIRETFLLARKRAVEPRNIENTPLARFLPATIASVTFRGISISNNLAVNNNFELKLKTI